METWCDDIDDGLPHRDLAVRSLLTLRLLTYSPSGAPVAAPTTSLPEDPGGSRNWDYRFAWPRDASIGIGAFLGVGKVDEARRFLAWLLHASRLDRPRLPVLLTLHGRHPAPERELPAGRATPPAGRSASATAPPTSTNSTATGGSSTPPGCSSEPATTSTPRRGGPCAASPMRCRRDGPSPMPASGRFVATVTTTCTRSSWPGSLSTGRSASPPRIARPLRQQARWRTRARRDRRRCHRSRLQPHDRQLHAHLRLD